VADHLLLDRGRPVAEEPPAGPNWTPGAGRCRGAPRCITIEDGPDPQITRACSAPRGARRQATFFCIGDGWPNIRLAREIVQRGTPSKSHQRHLHRLRSWARALAQEIGPRSRPSRRRPRSRAFFRAPRAAQPVLEPVLAPPICAS